MWSAQWLVLQEQGKRKIPAFSFLLSIDKSPRTHLLQIVQAVRVGGPHRWSDTQSHDKMEGPLDDLHEARDRHGQTLYRLYLKWVADTKTVWILDGRTKPNQTALPDSEYDKIRAFANKVSEDPPPAATADDFASLLLEAE